MQPLRNHTEAMRRVKTLWMEKIQKVATFALLVFSAFVIPMILGSEKMALLISESFYPGVHYFAPPASAIILALLAIRQLWRVYQHHLYAYEELSKIELSSF